MKLQWSSLYLNVFHHLIHLIVFVNCFKAGFLIIFQLNKWASFCPIEQVHFTQLLFVFWNLYTENVNAMFKMHLIRLRCYPNCRRTANSKKSFVCSSGLIDKPKYKPTRTFSANECKKMYCFENNYWLLQDKYRFDAGFSRWFKLHKWLVLLH